MGAFLLWEPLGGETRSLYFDLCKEETQTLKSTATEHPVETGANIADHVKRELDSVTLEVKVSNHPIVDVNGRGSFVGPLALDVQTYTPPFAPTPGAVFSTIGRAIRSLFRGPSPSSAMVRQFPAGFDAVAETLEILDGLRKDVQLVTVVTSKRDYENMFLESITVTRNREAGSGASFSLSFKEIRKVDVRIVNAPIPTQPRAKLAKAKGAQGAKTASPADKANGKTFAKGLLDRFAPGFLP